MIKILSSSLLANILSIFAIVVSTAIYVLGSKILTKDRVEHDQNMRIQFRKILDDFYELKNDGYLQLRNSRMIGSSKKVFLNKFSRTKGYSRKNASLVKVYSNGIWVSFTIGTNIETMNINGKDEDLYVFIPYKWIEIVDKENGSNSDFVATETIIIYVRSPWFMWPYHHRYPLDVDDSLLTEEVWKNIKTKEKELRKKYRYGNNDDLFE